MNYIHPQAILHESVVVEPFSTIYDNVVIGENTWIGPNVTIFSGARIGSNCKIFPGAVISAIPQDLKFEGEETLTIIGNSTVIRECVTINRGTKASGQTTVGNHCLLMAYTHIAHDCTLEEGVIISNSVQMAGHVHIGQHANVGGSSAIHQFARVGSYAMVGGGSLVRKDVPPYVLCSDEPLIYIGVNSVGLTRKGFSTEQVNQIQEIYRYVFQRKLNTSQAIEAIKNDFEGNIFGKEIVSFLEKSERGIIKRP
jgi:UDP-N-acetylglucosamine acyltransferase